MLRNIVQLTFHSMVHAIKMSTFFIFIPTSYHFSLDWFIAFCLSPSFGFFLIYIYISITPELMRLTFRYNKVPELKLKFLLTLNVPLGSFYLFVFSPHRLMFHQFYSSNWISIVLKKKKNCLFSLPQNDWRTTFLQNKKYIELNQ